MSNLPRSNNMIRVPSVRVISDDGQQIGVVPTYEAIRLAKEQGLDLVEINPKVFPPVCKIMDFGKFKYEQKKKEKEIIRAQKVVETKTLTLRPTTGDHDLEVKAAKVKLWLQEGNKVRIIVGFKGRESAHPQIALEAVQKILDLLDPNLYLVEEKLTMGGKQMVGLLSPVNTD